MKPGQDGIARHLPCFGQRGKLPGRLARFALRFAADERGVTAVVFGIMFAILFFVMAISLDYANARREQSRQQTAADAAALAASHYLGLENQDVDGPEYGKRFFKENMGAGTTAEVEVVLDASAGTVEANAQDTYWTRLMKAVIPVSYRRDKLDVGARSTVVKGGRVELAMALDNSGSMAGTKIEALRTAANDLISILFAGEEGEDDVRIGVVPFAASVNVGSGYSDANWIYRGAEQDLRWPLFTGSASRFDILGQMNRSWSGCVEARPAPYDTLDTPPDEEDTDTLFVPMFAPDEPDDVNASEAGYSTSGGDSSGYNNNYISDFEGSCPTPAQRCVAWRTKNGVKSCKTYGPVPIGVSEAQTRSCKYEGATPGSPEGSASGPQAACTTPPILPLTSNRLEIEGKITDLVASGNTNVSEGAMWAWRVLSPGAPFTEGRGYHDQTNRKFMIVMTDGDNYLQSKSQHNKSVYAAYGYGSQDRLGTTYTQNSYMSNINSKTLSACSNAKAQGITVYTVAFGTNISSTGLSLLRSCANSSDHAFIASDEAALIQTFQAIAREISKLRLNS